MSRPSLLTVAQVAQQLAVCPKTVRRLVARGDLPAIHVGRAVRIEPATLDAYMARQTSTPPEAVVRPAQALQGPSWRATLEEIRKAVKNR